MLVSELGGGLELHRTGPEHADRLEELQRIVFPTLADDQRFKAAHYRHHIEMFPDGQLCVLDGERMVGMTSTLRLDIEGAAEHTFAEVIQGGWLTSHQPAASAGPRVSVISGGNRSASTPYVSASSGQPGSAARMAE